MEKIITDELSTLIHDSIWKASDSEAKECYRDTIKFLHNNQGELISLIDIDEITESLPMEYAPVNTYAGAIISYIITGGFQSNESIYQLWVNARRSVDLIVSEETFVSANIITVRVKENGWGGGDAGHGGFVKISITDEASTNMYVNGVESHYFELEVRGDTERETLTQALEFALKTLKENE